MDIAPQPDRGHQRRADSVPGARRCQPRADGLEHAAPGRAAARPDVPIVAPAWKSRPRCDSGQVVVADEDGEVISVTGRNDRDPERARARAHLSRCASTTAPTRSHLHRPAPGCRQGPARQEGRGHRRLVLDRSMASWRWARTCWWHSCPGKAATTKTPF